MSDSTKKKNFISGSAKEKVFDNGGELINLSLKLEQLAKIADEKGYVRITIQRLKEVDRFGNSHSIFEDTFKPQPKNATPKQPTPVQIKSNNSSSTGSIGTDDYPF